MSININNVQFKAFTDFAQNVNEKTAVRLSPLVGENGEVRSVVAKGGDYKGNVGRLKASREVNNAVRDLFRQTIAAMFNGEDHIPESVRDAMKLKDYGGDGKSTSGKPLTARRIMAVKAAIDNLPNNDAEAGENVNAGEPQLHNPVPVMVDEPNAGVDEPQAEQEEANVEQEEANVEQEGPQVELEGPEEIKADEPAKKVFEERKGQLRDLANDLYNAPRVRGNENVLDSAIEFVCENIDTPSDTKTGQNGFYSRWKPGMKDYYVNNNLGKDVFDMIVGTKGAILAKFDPKRGMGVRMQNDIKVELEYLQLKMVDIHMKYKDDPARMKEEIDHVVASRRDDYAGQSFTANHVDSINDTLKELYATLPEISDLEKDAIAHEVFSALDNLPVAKRVFGQTGKPEDMKIYEENNLAREIADVITDTKGCIFLKPNGDGTGFVCANNIKDVIRDIATKLVEAHKECGGDQDRFIDAEEALAKEISGNFEKEVDKVQDKRNAIADATDAAEKALGDAADELVDKGFSRAIIDASVKAALKRCEDNLEVLEVIRDTKGAVLLDKDEKNNAKPAAVEENGAIDTSNVEYAVGDIEDDLAKLHKKCPEKADFDNAKADYIAKMLRDYEKKLGKDVEEPKQQEKPVEAPKPEVKQQEKPVEAAKPEVKSANVQAERVPLDDKEGAALAEKAKDSISALYNLPGCNKAKLDENISIVINLSKGDSKLANSLVDAIACVILGKEGEIKNRNEVEKQVGDYMAKMENYRKADPKTFETRLESNTKSQQARGAERLATAMARLSYANKSEQAGLAITQKYHDPVMTAFGKTKEALPGIGDHSDKVSDSAKSSLKTLGDPRRLLGIAAYAGNEDIDIYYSRNIADELADVLVKTAGCMFVELDAEKLEMGGGYYGDVNAALADIARKMIAVCKQHPDDAAKLAECKNDAIKEINDAFAAKVRGFNDRMQPVKEAKDAAKETLKNAGAELEGHSFIFDSDLVNVVLDECKNDIETLEVIRDTKGAIFRPDREMSSKNIASNVFNLRYRLNQLHTANPDKADFEKAKSEMIQKMLDDYEKILADS